MQQTINDICKIIRKHDLSYDQFQYACKQARQKMNLKLPTRRKRLPVLLTDTELNTFLSVLATEGDLKKILIFDLMLYSGLRVNEALNIEVKDIYIQDRKILIRQGKGNKDRYVLYPANIQFKVIAMINSCKDYLFRNPSMNKPYSNRTVQLWAKEIAKKSGIEKDVHPHLFRHHFATMMKKKGMPDEHVSTLMGHSSMQSTKTYTHLTPESFQGEYDVIVNQETRKEMYG